MKMTLRSIAPLLVLAALFVASAGGCPDDSTVGQSGDSAVAGEDVGATGDGAAGDVDAASADVGGVDVIADTTTSDTASVDHGLMDTTPDVALDTTQPDTTQPDATQLPDAPTSSDPVVQACVDLIFAFCTDLLAECQALPLVGPLITEDFLNTCQATVAHNGDSVLGLCEQVPTLTGDQFGPLQTMGPVFVDACIDGFQCTQEMVTQLGAQLVPMITDLAGGGSPDMTGILDIALTLCGF